jgi:hypothetical protein
MFKVFFTRLTRSSLELFVFLSYLFTLPTLIDSRIADVDGDLSNTGVPGIVAAGDDFTLSGAVDGVV